MIIIILLCSKFILNFKLRITLSLIILNNQYNNYKISIIIIIYRDNNYNEKLTELNNSLDILDQTINNNQTKNKQLINLTKD